MQHLYVAILMFNNVLYDVERIDNIVLEPLPVCLPACMYIYEYKLVKL